MSRWRRPAGQSNRTTYPEVRPMVGEREPLRDGHRLFDLLRTDFFTGTPFEVAGRLPDGLEGLRAHNLVTFKSHHEALDAWAVKELSRKAGVAAPRLPPPARPPLTAARRRVIFGGFGRHDGRPGPWNSLRYCRLSSAETCGRRRSA
ncbi:MAG: hypothetical protein J2P46_21600 [Zavarzinella sp.]|nr:hypothetical protein [Zavarzinella sp.]